ncbi:bifunctional ADP-dependent NAD(P)H-hydrate dehydratase/NAD(P)H-hydrate epimerase [Defluviitalea phaphyphila]|uniref:bifunctional ADP-dependent NAD(P)H-hydrate dehydratase/NAD(P)H-hydrate epimerase n=1 Tax=Defluviitalea phaphyphila TaxID=1473580 RepID=UPI0007300DA4|nr:bifunctional ADP-dependent NAD(P)H-hydrate dehydratase/NAD(P)H-hydrate epimerase [Defluviitalea phaphyphila]
MKVCDGKEMREIDNISINKMGIPGIVLMENAVLSIVKEIKDYLKNINNPKVAIVCGQGNNGGDGLGVARHLHNYGIDVDIVFIGNPDLLKNDAKINFKITENLSINKRILNLNSIIDDDIINIIRKSDLIVDAIFGTGLTRKIEGILSELIDLINFYGKYIISIDIPSGIDSRTGEILGNAIKANKTVTLALPKSGLYLYPGTEFVGELVIADIGIPKEVINSMKLKMNILTEKEVEEIIPKRFKRSNKSTYGKVLVLAGAKGMTGAATLTCKGAFRIGAGLVSLGVPRSINDILEEKLTEVITIPLEEEKGKLCEKSFEDIKSHLKKYKVIAVGPGIGQSKEITKFIDLLVKNVKTPIVVDADGINTISKKIDILKNLKVPLILTPHPGEMARLTGKTIEEILANPIKIVKEFCHKWNVILVLKDSRAIIGNPDGEIYINTTGNPGMSTAGSGDVLTGIIAGLIGQNVDPYKAAVLGTFLHGKAGDLAAIKLGQHGMMAGDIVNHIPKAIKLYYKNKY